MTDATTFRYPGVGRIIIAPVKRAGTHGFVAWQYLDGGDPDGNPVTTASGLEVFCSTYAQMFEAIQPNLIVLRALANAKRGEAKR